MDPSQNLENPGLLVFADDWGRHPSSCQHLIGHLLDRYQVYWVNTIGTRKPSFDLATLRRALEKVRHWFRRKEVRADVPSRLQVLNPKMWPRFTSGFDRLINRCLLGRPLRNLVRSLPVPPVAITTLPIVADLMGLLPVKHWLYYCVDDFSEWPGLDGATMRRMEEVVVQRADTLIAVSETLQDKLARMGRTSHLLTHGVELDFWRRLPGGAAIAALAGLERPLVVFWGVIDRRMDVNFVRHLGENLAKGTIVLAGPEADPDPALFACPRVVRLGRLDYEQLPHLAQEASVLVMPYADLPVTRAMQPLKLKEYLVTGKPVVVRHLPATRNWNDCLDLATTPEMFVESVRLRLASGLPDSHRMARARLAEESWSAKSQLFESWILPQTTGRVAA